MRDNHLTSEHPLNKLKELLLRFQQQEDKANDYPAMYILPNPPPNQLFL